MKFKAKIIISICSMFIMVFAMTVGIFAVTDKNLTINANVGFKATEVDLYFTGSTYGNKGDDVTYTKDVPYSTITESFSWTIGAVAFDALEKNEFVVGVAVRNRGENPVTIVKVNEATALSNTVVTYREWVGTSGEQIANQTILNNAAYYANSSVVSFADLGHASLAENTIYYFAIVYTVQDWEVTIPATPIGFSMSYYYANTDN